MGELKIRTKIRTEIRQKIGQELAIVVVITLAIALAIALAVGSTYAKSSKPGFPRPPESYVALRRVWRLLGSKPIAVPPCNHATMPPCHHATMPPCFSIVVCRPSLVV